MDFLKALFGDGKALTFEEFTAQAQAAKMNLADLSKGGYVSEAKFNDKVNGLTQQVTHLTEQIAQRDADMATLRTDLEAAQADAGKLPGVQQALTDLQTKYTQDAADYENRMARQRYEFMVTERANGLKFSSTAARKAFVQEAIGKDFKVDGDTLLGYEDFVNKYKADDPGAFAPETPPAPDKPKPEIVLPTGNPPAPDAGAFSGLFHFNGVRPKQE